MIWENESMRSQSLRERVMRLCALCYHNPSRDKKLYSLQRFHNGPPPLSIISSKLESFCPSPVPQPFIQNYSNCKISTS